MGSKATFLRFLAQIGMGVLIFVYVVWGLKIFWGN
jgi:succinate dehydrogenase / fumarate reductase membrane anchor subunit